MFPRDCKKVFRKLSDAKKEQTSNGKNSSNIAGSSKIVKRTKRSKVALELPIVECLQVLDEVKGLLHYKFHNKKLLEIAFTHASFLDKNSSNKITY
jgi:hypothetical protein